MTPKTLPLRLLALFILCIGDLIAQVSYENAFPEISFNFPVELQSSIDGSDRLFVLEQPGIIKVFPNRTNITNPEVSTFLDISDKVSFSTGQEIGLLGMAFHPQFNSNGFVFIYYIDRPSNYRINISRFQVSESNPNTLNVDSEFIIAQFVKDTGDSNHNGGKIAFGPDGYLYASIGDGGGAGDPRGNGQNLETVFGSMIRLDVDLNGDNPLETNPAEPNGHYEIPSDNPRVNLTGLDELYAWGLRNTWKFSFDGQGRIWAADVGQNLYEEINIIEKGGNYGWNMFEAMSQPSYGAGTVLATTPDIKPIYYYDQSAGDASITGGYVYKGNIQDDRIQNNYIYGDFVSGRVWALQYDENTQATENELLFQTNGTYISSFGEDENGELYFLGYADSAKIYKFTSTLTEPEVRMIEGLGEWRSLGSGTNGTVECLVEDTNGNIWVGGAFSQAGNISVNNLALFDNEGNWNNTISGTNGTIFDMAISNEGHLFIAGDFTEVGGISANNIAYYDGLKWYPLDTGTNGPVAKIAFNTAGNILYLGGVFTTSGNLTVNNIAKWENGTFQGLADANTGIVGTNNEIRAMAIDENDNLFVGGNFDSAGGVSANRIAHWDGSQWKPLGPGTTGFVQTIDIKDNFVYAGGNFVGAGNQTVNRIARYNLSTQDWEAIGKGVTGNVNELISQGDYIYVTGTFEAAGIPGSNPDEFEFMNNIARWSESDGWEALGTDTKVGIDTRGNALIYTNSNQELIVGGNFNQSGAMVNTNNIAKWALEFDQNAIDSDGDGVDDTIDECPDTPPNAEITENGCTILPFPSDQFTIKSISTSCIDTANGSINIISKTSGEFIAVLSDSNATESFDFDSSLTISNLAPGSYDLCLRSSTGEFFETCSIVSIGEPEPLSVLTSMDFLNKTVTLKVDGVTNYIVELNDKIIESNSNQITLPLDRINNELVVTSKECQGSYSETIILEDSLIAYPSPFKNILNIDLSNLQNEGVEINIFDITGKLVLNDKFIASENIRTLNTGNLHSGLYFIQLKIDQVVKVIKVIKS